MSTVGRFVWPFAIAAGIATSAFASNAFAEPVRILVSAGSKVGLQAERPLKFVNTDATRVRDVVVSLGGVKAEHAFVLSEPSRAQLFAAIDKAKTEAQKHKTDEVTLLFYFSGHGDRDAIHLGDDRVLVSDLTSKLGEVPAGLRIAVTDACRATRDKGFAADEPFAITATSMPQASGQVWLHASSDGEAAQESDELQGAIFTHAWLNGLRGAADANGDARVTLEESFAFAHSQTVIRSAKSSGVLQKPEAIVSLREMSPVVLTQTSARMATLSLPQGKDTHFVVFSAGARSVLSELWSSPDRRTTLRLPPGRYVIHRRNGAIGATAQIGIADGETRNIEEREFAASTLEALARKGGADDDAPADPDKIAVEPADTKTHHELSAGYDVGWNARTNFVHGPRAAYTFAWPRVALSIGGGADFASRTLTDNDEKLVGGYGRASLEARIPVGQLVLRLGGGGRAGVVSQSIASRVPDVSPGNVGGSSTPSVAGSSTAFVFGPEVFVMARVGLDRRASIFVDLGATTNVLFLREEGSLTGIFGVLGGASLGARF